MKFTDHHLTAPKLTARDAVTDLLNFSIVTWSVPPAALAAQLPEGFEPDIYRLDDGSEVSFVSAVPFDDDRFHFRFAPFVKVSMSQINLRAYVIYKGERVVWFFGTLLTGFWNWIPHKVWNLPWYQSRIDIQADWAGDRRLNVEAESELSDVKMSLSISSSPFERLDGFTDQEHAALVLTHPLKGFYYRRDGMLGSYSVWHDRLQLVSGSASHASVSLFEKLDLVTAGQKPHSVLAMPKTRFHVHLPPKAVRESA